MGLLKAIIKVGTSGSVIKFNNVKAIRAITTDDLKRLTVENPDASFIVIEPNGSDRETITSISNIPVYFFEDYDGLHDLQKRLSFDFKVNVRTYTNGVEAEEQAERERNEAAIKAATEAINNDDLDSLFGDEPEVTDNDTEEKEKIIVENNTEAVEEKADTTSENIEQNKTISELEEAVMVAGGNVEDDLVPSEDETDSIEQTVEPVEDDEVETIIMNASEEKEEHSEATNEAVKELEEELKRKNKSIEVKDKAIEQRGKLIESLEDKINFYEMLINRLEAQGDVIDIQTKDSEETLAKLNEYKMSMKALDNKVVSLQTQLGQIDALKLQLDEKDKNIEKLKDELAKAASEEKFAELRHRIDVESDIRLSIVSSMTQIVAGLADTKKSLTETLEELNRIKSENSDLTKELGETKFKLKQSEDNFAEKNRSYSERIRALNFKVDEYNKRVIQAGNDLRKAEKEKQEALNAQKTAELQVTGLNDTIKELQLKLNTVQNDLDVTSGLKDQYEEELNKYKAMNIDQMREDIKVGDISNSQLVQELGRTKQELQSVQYQLGKRDEIIKTLEEDKTRLELTNKGLARGVSTYEKLIIDINYTGKASIIPVFGRGGCGTTTTVMSIADRLPGNVLVLDFDTARPSIDGWVGMNPMIKTLPDLVGLDQSAFGALIKKGVQYVLDNRDVIMRKYREKKGQTLTYFSGYYGRVDMTEVASVNFSEFFNYFGSEYNYIVVDCGTLGGSECNNALIRSLNKIAWKNVMVCLHDKFDTRLMRIKSAEHGIMYAKTIWLLNFAKNTRIDDSMAQSLRGMNYTIFSRDMELFGARKTYYEFGNPNRDRVKELADQLIC